jgi:hypothetical protein
MQTPWALGFAPLPKFRYVWRLQKSFVVLYFFGEVIMVRSLLKMTDLSILPIYHSAEYILLVVHISYNY